MSKGKRVRAVRKEEEPQEPIDAAKQEAASQKVAKEKSEEPHEVLSAEEAEERADEGDIGDKGRPQFQVAGEDAQEALQKLKEQVTYWIDRGRYSKVRLKRNGKQLGPDIPVAALLALEAATFFGAGILRGAVMHAVGRVFFEVELINEAEEHYEEGLSLFLGGDLSGAEVCFSKAMEVDPRFAPAHLQMGVLCKVQNQMEKARNYFSMAQKLDPEGQTGAEAEVHLQKMDEAP